MTTTATYPSSTVAPSIETLFVNGIKFDICELIKEAYDMIVDKRFRYFVCVEDNHIVQFSACEKYFQVTGETRWDFFCITKGECIAWVNDYQQQCDKVASYNQSLAKKPLMRQMIAPKIQAINERCLTLFGVKAA